MGLLDRWRRRGPDPRAALVAPIEQALRELGWARGAVGPAAPVRSAFGAGEMPFEHWLGQVFLPRLHEARASGRWPSRSDVAVAARRNLDGCPDAAPLLQLLSRLDALINERGGDAR